jgi:outer membrane lipoprotein SlyB
MALIGRFGCAAPLLLAALAGCAAPRTLPSAPPAAPQAALHLSTIVDVRQVDISGDANGRAGVDAVLAALRQPPSSGAIVAQEVVMMRDDGTGTSLVERPPGNFQVGQHVAIIENGATLLAPQN